MNGEARPTGRRTWGARLRAWADRTGTEVLGWILIPVGIVLMPLPGPGMLIVVGGFALLARHYTWARQLLEPLQRKAVEAARYGVATWPRIVLSALGGVWLFAIGVVWIVGPTIPEFEVLNVGFGPELPAQGWVTGLGVIASAIVAWGLLAYSVARWRTPEVDVLPDPVAEVVEPVEPAEA
ncbi:PGPGW domain-containing protein [Aeromicrobium alkaliterrae]|uniref:PGPGW domain-containing protein n=1 Tax=Aeromicrobium alkaliterrae TaxID=302168 RepID=A0ABN2JUQ4_9ACTN